MKIALNLVISAIAILLIAVPREQAVGQEKEDPERAKTLQKVKELLRDNDSFAAIEYVNGLGEPRLVGTRYMELVLDLYWKERALSDVITMGRAGIDYCLTKALELPDDSEEAPKMRSAAKVIAYNVASFTWPGWDEKDLVISESDLKVGLDAAKLNLRLAKELKRDPSAMSMAHWVVGAQYLAAGIHLCLD